MIRFINRWTTTKQQLESLMDKLQTVQATLTEGPMGRIANALRATHKTVAESDARALRDLDQELRRVSYGERPT